MAEFDNSYQAVVSDEELNKLKPIVEDFVRFYSSNKDKPVKEWLTKKLSEQLPDKNDAEIQEIADNIIESINVTEEKKQSLNKAISDGRSTERWLASEIEQAAAGMTNEQTANYYQNLDEAVENANRSFRTTLTNEDGTISQNTNLDGFIAEQHHAQTFNLKAAVKGSDYKAEVLEPEGKRYVKNSVDIKISTKDGKTVARYQGKYGKDAGVTKGLFRRGDYRGQQKLVPAEQQAEIAKSTGQIQSPDGIKSTPLTKEEAVQLKKDAQSGNWKDLDWNNAYETKDLAIGLANQVGKASAVGALIGAGTYTLQKAVNGEDIETEEVVETALKTGADVGVKSAVAGALKVGAEKGIIKCIPKGTSANVCANIAFTAIEDVKVMNKVATGELSVEEGMDVLEQTTASSVAGLMSAGEGAAVGATIGSVAGPIGAAVGGFVGGTVAYMAGSKVAETVVKGVQKVRKKVREVVFDTAKKVVSGAKGVFSSVASFLGVF